MAFTKRQTVDWLRRCGDVFQQQRDFLTDLDTEIGDGDHGLNMQRGFSKVMEKLPAFADKDIGAIMKNTGMILLSSVGGASGPLFGSFFIRAAQSTAGLESLELPDLYRLLKEGVDGVVARGKAEPGDKTMCDVWWPVVAALKQAQEEGDALDAALDRAVAQAQRGLAGTIPMRARKGRASYLGERSVGHQDPGATSAMLMVQSLAAAAHQA